MSMEPVQRRLLSVVEFERMAEAGVFAPYERLELINGELIEMPPIGTRHAGVLTKLLERIFPQVLGEATVWVQNPLRLSPSTEVYPDLALLKPRADAYTSSAPQPADVLLVIEVSDTTFPYDRNSKVPLYSRHGIPEVWIVNLGGVVLESFRMPAGNTYDEIRRYGPGDTIAPALLPECAVRIGEILG